MDIQSEELNNRGARALGAPACRAKKSALLGRVPFLPTGHRLRAPLDRRFIPIPPRFLAVGFFMGAGAMVDLPSGREEEIGECFFSICLLMFMAHERQWNGRTRGVESDPARLPAGLSAVADRS